MNASIGCNYMHMLKYLDIYIWISCQSGQMFEEEVVIVRAVGLSVGWGGQEKS